ncbi:von Willebrand factor A domain-containing protein 7-like [Simochromis diagramma]|uniref:von Willebrand factor A domain-containing protein 7-like n=1 Tax=Simochromis diagramma TaxID=43689 RepID=UPI001A7EC78D|nr:von Willebrand factor A domain-containing protein 7-like [Simochromis diagramma]XP_039890207.1 von Willebrand factor A domain-containing protein 7-like [Simochromis diagramma]
MTTRQSVMLLLVLVLSLPGLIHSFKPLFNSNSFTHREITRIAVLRKTAEVCRDIAASKGLDFNLIIDNNLSAGEVQRACSSMDTFTSFVSTIKFETAIASMYLSNAAVDALFLLSAARHFDDETFQEGRDIITEGASVVKAHAKIENYIRGRWSLGQICHTLQDFYSHSNWVELGNKAPYSALIRPDQPLKNLAGQNTPTCRSCVGENCTNNILPDVLNQGLLTSGYFSIISSSKPTGKCSHGGSADRTSRRDPVGGINKDTLDSSHGFRHNEAANLAIRATMELLEDIRLAAGDTNFMRLMGLSQSPVLCFVIDTTGSMSDDIDEAKRVSFEIIDRKRGTGEEPSGYILVPFNDPDFGPIVMTSNADIFKGKINSLTAAGGGDTPEMALSGLQLALTAAPPFSEIFLFTDAPAKDAHLKNTIIALIESTKSQVTFMLTGSAAGRRRRRTSQGVAPRVMGRSAVQLYQDLAEASGGQAIQVTKSELSLATSVIVDSSASAVVTVFQAARNPGRPDSFNFTVDSSLQNITAYITGDSALTFSLTSSTGVSQTSNQSSGPLAFVTTAGNLRRLSLNTDNETGLWQLSVSSSNPYLVKVTGQSSVDFIYNLVEEHEGAHGDFSVKEGRPLSGGNTSFLITVTGSDTVKVTEVTLFDSSGPTEVKGSLQSLGSSDFLVTFSGIPAGEFVLILKGEDSSSTSRSTSSSFQRQASTQIKTSSISVTAEANNTNIEPGTTISIPFSVATTADGVITDTATETFTVRVSNDRSYTSISPSSVTTVTGSGGKANGTVTLTAPSSAASGTDVTLTIEAENSAATDINYVVLRFSVSAKVTDVNRPVCQVVNTSTCASTSLLCASSQWEFIANFTDGINGTGIESVTIRQGNGTLNMSTVVEAGGENITLVTYTASCCSPIVELTAVDSVGNVGTCVGQARVLTTPPPTTPTPATTTAVQTTSTGGYTLNISTILWLSVVFSVLLK